MGSAISFHGIIMIPITPVISPQLILGIELKARAFRFAQHASEFFRIEMPLIERDPAILHHARHNSGFGRARTDRANAAVSFRDPINFRTHLRGGQKCVAAPVHRRAAGMRGLSVKGDGMTFDAESSKHSSERKVEIEEHRALSDVQLEISGCVAQFFAALLHSLEIDSVFFQCIDQTSSVFIFKNPCFVHVDLA